MESLEMSVRLRSNPFEFQKYVVQAQAVLELYSRES